MEKYTTVDALLALEYLRLEVSPQNIDCIKKNWQGFKGKSPNESVDDFVAKLKAVYLGATVASFKPANPDYYSIELSLLTSEITKKFDKAVEGLDFKAKLRQGMSLQDMIKESSD